jgi:crotonobetainyl-CoA:carnitine CoA-transferase CaiB-like acyl-CoA transferase
MKSPFKPLAGTKILDLTRVLAGPWCTQILADLGGDVVKVERVEGGDDTRKWGPPQFVNNSDGTRETAFFLAANRGKRSAAIDYSKPGGAELIRALAAEADILIENMKVGDLARYGLDASTLRRFNPRLIYCSVTGYGQTGPYAGKPGYDYLAQAVGGLMSVTGWPDGADGAGPMKIGVPIIDIMTGVYASNAILAALRNRDRVGVGCELDVSLLDVALATLSHPALAFLATGTALKRTGNSSPTISPYDSFETAAGKIIITAGNEGQFQRLCKVLGVPELAGDPRFKDNHQRVLNREALIHALQLRLITNAAADWIILLDEANVPACRINDISEVLENPQIKHRGLIGTLPHPDFGEVPYVATPVHIDGDLLEPDRGPPCLGAHTSEVLRDWLGTGEAELSGLLRSGAAAQS